MEILGICNWSITPEWLHSKNYVNIILILPIKLVCGTLLIMKELCLQTLPSSFMDRFGHIIPSSVKIKLVNGEDINGKFLRNESLIFGLLPIVQKKYVSSGDILIFNYSGNGEFDLSIYDESRTEKLFNVEVVEIGKKYILEIGFYFQMWYFTCMCPNLLYAK